MRFLSVSSIAALSLSFGLVLVASPDAQAQKTDAQAREDLASEDVASDETRSEGAASERAALEGALPISGNLSRPVEVDKNSEPASEPPAKDAILEKPVPHQGHYIAFGLHLASAYVNDANRGPRGPGLGEGYSLRLGEGIAPWLDLGIAFAFGKTYGKEAWRYGRLTVHGQVYPQDNWFVHGGFGFGVAGGTDLEDPEFERGRFGDVYTGGVGINLPITAKDESGGWIFSPVLTAEYGRDSVFPNTALWLGIELSYWTGLPRRQLDLDFDKAYR